MELWDHWKRAGALKLTGRAFGEPSSSVYHQVMPHGADRDRSREDERRCCVDRLKSQLKSGPSADRIVRGKKRPKADFRKKVRFSIRNFNLHMELKE